MLKLSVIKWPRPLSATPLVSHINKASVFHHMKTYYPDRVGNAQGESEISNLFADKFQNLYNCVSLKKKEDMDSILNYINGLVITTI